MGSFYPELGIMPNFYKSLLPIKHKVFYSFHYKNDVRRAAQIKNIGFLEGNKPCQENEWEEIKQNNNAIKNWIDQQMEGRTCCIVLVGQETAYRPWVQYEIKHAWNRGMGVFGIYIHNVKDPIYGYGRKGANPFSQNSILSSHFQHSIYAEPIIPCYDPVCTPDKGSYNDIAQHMKEWIEDAISRRKQYPL